MEEKIGQVLRLLAMDIREYMSQEKWVDDAKRALYPIIFSNRVDCPVKPACVNCKYYKEINKQDYNEHSYTIEWCNLHNYGLSMWNCGKTGCTEFESKSV